MADPVTIAIATAVAGKTAESLTGQLSRPVAAIIARIRDRFRDRPADAELIAAPERAADLAAVLQTEMDSDPSFCAEITALWRDASTVNIVHGNVEKAVQVRDVHGDVHVN